MNGSECEGVYRRVLLADVVVRGCVCVDECERVRVRVIMNKRPRFRFLIFLV